MTARDGYAIVIPDRENNLSLARPKIDAEYFGEEPERVTSIDVAWPNV